MKKEERLKIGVVGFGYWSPKLIRAFNSTGEANIVAVCDKDEARLALVNNELNNVKTYQDYNQLFASPDIDAVIITTIVSSHFRIAKAALLAGKHVLVEKPITETEEETLVLEDIARKKGLTLMVDHTFLYSPAVRTLKQTIDSGVVGKVISISGKRNNLGLFQRDTNVLFDLAPHDFSILIYLLGRVPDYVSAFGNVLHKHEQQERAQEAITHVTCIYNNGPLVLFEQSWLAPFKDRKVVIIGDKGMIVYDMQNQDTPLLMSTARVELKKTVDRMDPLFDHIQGDLAPVSIPQIDGDDLTRLAKEFISCVKDRSKEPLTGSAMGEKVVRILNAANTSLRKNGSPIKVRQTVRPHFIASHLWRIRTSFNRISRKLWKITGAL